MRGWNAVQQAIGPLRPLIGPRLFPRSFLRTQGPTPRNPSMKRGRRRSALVDYCCELLKQSRLPLPSITLAAAYGSLRPQGRRQLREYLRAKKIRRAGGTRRISPTSFQIELVARARGSAWPRTGCRSQSPVPKRSLAGSAVESGEMMIPPASQSEGDLVHIARTQPEIHFARSIPLIVARDEDCGDCWRISRGAGRSAGSRPSFGFNSARSRKASA
jgi:hypothetical protein